MKHTKGEMVTQKAAYNTSIKITKGKTNVVESEDVAICIVSGHDNEESHANTKLICDAFNVTNETGLTPRELQAKLTKLEAVNRELVEALEMVETVWNEDGDNGEIQMKTPIAWHRVIRLAEQALNNAKQ